MTVHTTSDTPQFMPKPGKKKATKKKAKKKVTKKAPAKKKR